MKIAFDIINKLDMSFDQKASIDLVKYPLLTEKTIKLIEQNQYSFAVDANATKTSVKSAIEKLFDVKVIPVNTSLQAIKKRRVGRFIGKKSQYKRAIVTLAPENSITLFEDV
jgi:large subunit ribosomal protein L23